MRIILVRHGESAANADKNLHGSMADHAIPLSELGFKQAYQAGVFLGRFLSETLEETKDPIDSGKTISTPVRLWLSPYKRTRETADCIFSGIKTFERENGAINMNLDSRENIRLCEQQFGLFDGIPDDERHLHYPAEAEHYAKCEDQEGQFWARMPLGESRFDVANRVHQTFGTFHRDNDRHDIGTIIVVCHGVTLRAFVMQWLHLTPEWFDTEPNPGNCDIRLIEDGEDCGYIYRGALE